MPQENPTHLWLKEAGIYPKYRRYEHFGCGSPAILTFAAMVSLIWVKTLWWLPLILAALAFASHRYSRWMFFREIVCPRCGYNPTRRKSDGARRKDYHKVLSQLSGYRQCPNCGPGEKEEAIE